MESVPLIILVGGGALAERVCAELTLTAGHAVRVLWPLEVERRSAFTHEGSSVVPLAPDTDAALVAAGIFEAASILLLSKDDELNLAVALRARMLNPAVRVVLRQFNGRRRGQNRGR